MLDLETLSTRYLAQWEMRANVRRPERHRVKSGIDPRLIANPMLVPALTHPLVEEAGAEVKSFLIMQGVYDYLKGVADCEGDIILSVCGQAGSSLGRDLLPPVAQRALQTVSTDEGFHTFVAEEMIADLIDVTGIDHRRPENWFGCQTMIADGLNLALSRALPEARLALHLAFVALLENGITEEMIEHLRSTDRESPFYQFNLEHVRDEARHRQFFRAVLSHIWATLDPEVRRSVAENLPYVLASYLRSMHTPLPDLERYRLHEAGLSLEKAQQVAEDCVRKAGDIRNNGIWKNIWECMHEAGMLNDRDFYRALMSEGLVPDGDQDSALAA